MAKKVEKVLFLPKWYPDKYDKQFGVFLQKHAKAVSLYAKVAVLYVTPDPTQKETFIVDETTENGFLELRIYYRKSESSNAISRKLANLRRYLKGSKMGLKVIEDKFGLPDITHVNILTRPGAIAFRMKKKYGIPYVITEQWTGYGSDKFKLKGKFEQNYALKVGKNAGAILTVSNSLKGHMQRHGFENDFHIIRNIIEDIDVSKNASPDPKRVKMMNISDLDDEKKNVSGIINVFAKVAKDLDHIELHIIGGGDDEEMLRDLARSTGLYEDRIFLYGRRFNDFVYEQMPQMNFLITNSNFETFSVATAEAIINGKPVIVTRCGGPEEFVTEEVGLVIDREADDQLETAMRHMIAHHDDYDPQTLSTYAHNNFSYEKVGQHFMEIYQSIVH
jgi:glycosyltransferase involved in cell wall biosynthesis